ncbi:helix-turn-helix domain-containing protein [Maritimibacter sp. DP07]|jgi:CRP/FNR family transcriptional regulator|uniref:Helix-turn-helix domain-containing protein n=1 Tax=Maritimibacter harenae TaxID=2606218 RepID=A0A845M1J1_9RHOB|nr:Crp/Fnr family transcriptional regulator [Maritimibacter harenae]MZR11587.1 helix-turn-helix domain-containing protein [Maritimibacter harenae]
MPHAHGPTLCSACPLAEAGLPPAALGAAGAAIGVIQVAKGQLRTCEDLSNHFAIVRKGALKVEFLNPDGRAEIAGFLFQGEVLVCSVSDQDVAITALEDAAFCDVRPDRIAQDVAGAAAALTRFTQAVADQSGLDQRRLIQARSGPVEDRLMWFLEDVAARQKSDAVHLPMPRSDIAHYLNTSAESVSRAFTNLRARGAIETRSPRRITLTN